jgi:L-xylulokinase
MGDKACYIGVDIGLTSAKAAGFDSSGAELFTVRADNPRVAVSIDRQEIDMVGLWDVVSRVLSELTVWLASHDFQPRGIGVTGHGNGLYAVDNNLRPVRPAIASTDNRAEEIVARTTAKDIEAERLRTGSVPWAGQPSVLLAWLAESEPESFAATAWVLSCKDWITTCLTGAPTADLSDASGCGLVNLSLREYDPTVFERLGLPATTIDKFPRLRASDEIAGSVTAKAAERTGLLMGLPVIAGCMDCIASPIGAGSTQEKDVTIIVGTWAINSVVVPTMMAPPNVTLNALLPEQGLMLAQEDAPTSAANLEWLSGVVTTTVDHVVTPRNLLEAAESAPAGSEGLIFLPFVHGAPGQRGASGTLLGAKGLHTHAHLARAVAEGVAQYHRVQLETMKSSGMILTGGPWTLAGGGARNPLWAQIFADVIQHPVRRQLGTELGARGVASLVYSALGGNAADWIYETNDSLLVHPSENVDRYSEQARVFDSVLSSMGRVWENLLQSDGARRDL